MCLTKHATSITWLSVSQNYWYVVWCKISLHHVDLSVQHIVILSPCKRRQQLGVWESCPSTSGLVCYCRFIHVLGLCSHGLCVCLEQSCRWTPKATIITGQGHYVFWCVCEREGNRRGCFEGEQVVSWCSKAKEKVSKRQTVLSCKYTMNWVRFWWF